MAVIQFRVGFGVNREGCAVIDKEKSLLVFVSVAPVCRVSGAAVFYGSISDAS